MRYRLGPQAGVEFSRFAAGTEPAPPAVGPGAEALVAEILETTQDPHSEAFYRRLARRAVGEPHLMDLIYRCLSEVKVEAREGTIRNRGAAFTDKLKRYCRAAGIELRLRGFES